MTTHKKGYGTGKVYSSNYLKDNSKYKKAFSKKYNPFKRLFDAMWSLVKQAFGGD